MGSVKSPAHESASFCLNPGEYDIVLIVDKMEQTGARKDKGAIQEKLRSMGVQVEVRQLNLGDFLWIAKERVQPEPGSLAMPIA